MPYVMRRRTRPTVSHDLLDADSTLKNLKHRHSVRDCFFPPQRGLNFQDIRICFKVLGRKVKKKKHCTIQSFIIRYHASGNVESRGMFFSSAKEVRKSCLQEHVPG